jgi:anti-sigma factor RsiW
MSACRRLLPYLDPFVDGELSPEKTLEVEQHLGECPTCRERMRLQHAIQASTRRAVREAAVATDSFRERVTAALAAERDREVAQSQLVGRPRMLPWRTIVPLAAAAAVALLWAARLGQQQPLAQPDQQGSVTRSTALVDQMLDDFVDAHANPPKSEVVEEAMVGRLEPEVGVPVRVPSFKQFGAEWEGGSVVRLMPQHRTVASLRYNLGGHRITVYVYDAARIPLRVKLQARVVHNVPVYVGFRRGYSIAATENERGVGYAMASDLDDTESAELVADSFH